VIRERGFAARLSVHVTRLTQTLQIGTLIGRVGASELPKGSLVVDWQRCPDEPSARGAAPVLLDHYHSPDSQPCSTSIGLWPTHPKRGLIPCLVGASVGALTGHRAVKPLPCSMGGPECCYSAVTADNRNVMLAFDFLGCHEDTCAPPGAAVRSCQFRPLAVKDCSTDWTRKVRAAIPWFGSKLVHRWVACRTSGRAKNQARLRPLATRRPDCDCLSASIAVSLHRRILPPFVGSGTTLLVAEALGRDSIGLDLSSDYARLAKWRASQRSEKVLSRTWQERQGVLL